MLVRDILRKRFTRLDASATLPEICKIFAERHIASAPVHKNGKFIGIVSDTAIVQEIKKRKLGQVWRNDRETAVLEISKITAQTLAKKPDVVLSPEERMSEATLKIIRKSIDLVPVVDEDGQLAGIVRGTDLMAVLLTDFAKFELKSAAPPAGVSESGAESVETIVDRVLSIVSKRGTVGVSELSSETGVPRQQLEKIAKSLEAHRLIEIDYKLFGGMSLKVHTNE